MNNLFNSPVVDAQPMQRDMLSSDHKTIPLGSHSGTQVTLEDGSKHFIHKGPDFTPSNPTAITDAPLSKNWKPVGESYNPGTTVGGMMDHGPYNALSSNCNHATANQPGSTVTTDALGANIVPK
eukprot:TRINITY_DN12662_c0_g1_i1.p1 TRINITY_DN12662_c0_g1~~TRINITY_DN12662_c0_g1_i1.p1  ORF type:complete len:137 (+),score=29.14 TRINITY_DN12662_c0_g1_i1:40-411(+)